MHFSANVSLREKKAIHDYSIDNLSYILDRFPMVESNLIQFDFDKLYSMFDLDCTDILDVQLQHPVSMFLPKKTFFFNHG